MVVPNSSRQPYSSHQGMEQSGVVSVWVVIKEHKKEPDSSDWFEFDFDLAGSGESDLVPVEKLLADLPHAHSFMDEAVHACRRAGLERGSWIMCQYDYAHDPMNETSSGESVFLGVFTFEQFAFDPC